MKKILVIAIIMAVFTSCGAGSVETPVADSAAVAADTLEVVADSVVVIDTTAEIK
jgi:hypothetical protein